MSPYHLVPTAGHGQDASEDAQQKHAQAQAHSLEDEDSDRDSDSDGDGDRDSEDSDSDSDRDSDRDRISKSVLGQKEGYTIKYSRSPREMPEAETHGIFWGPRLYFIVYPNWSHNTDILNYNSSIVLPRDQHWQGGFSVLLQQLDNTGKCCPVDWTILESSISI